MSCVTYHYDTARTGWLQRGELDTGMVMGRAWGKYQQLNLGSPVRGAVLFLEGWTLRGGPHSGETHTVLYVATSDNHVLCFSEEELRAGGATPLWQTALDPPNMRHGSNIPPPIGVAGTPVLDPDQRRMFVVAMTDNGQGGGVYRAYVLSLDTGNILENVPLLDPGGAGRPAFDGNHHDQRCALLIVAGRVYVCFADFLADDQGDYHGWVVSFDVDNLSDQRYLPITSAVTGGGIWGPGGAASGDDSNVFVVTGNAPSADGSYWGGLHTDTHPGDYGDFFEAVVRVDAAQAASTGTWTGPIAVPGWFGAENQGGGVALADLNGSGRPDLIAFHIDNPSGENHGYYRIGWDLDSAGNVTGGWTGPVEVPGWFGAENQGGGIAVARLPWRWTWS